MKGYRYKKLYRLRVLLLTIMFLGSVQLFAQEQVSKVVSSGGGFTSGESYTGFSVIGGGPMKETVTGGSYSTSIGFLFSNVFTIDRPEFNLFVEAFPENSGLVIGAGIYQEGDMVMVSASTEPGFEFIGWGAPAGTFEDVNLAETYFNMPAEEVRITAYFADSGSTATTSQINVSAFPETFGTISGTGEYLDGSVLNLTAVPAEGYQFISWTENDVIISTSADYSFEVGGDRNIVANYALEYFTITLESLPANNIGGSVQGGGTYAYGTEITVSASENLGFTFEGWKDKGIVSETNQVYTFIVTEDRDLSGLFSGQLYNVTSNASPQTTGSTTGDGEYYFGDIVSLTAEPAEGYYFIRWMEGDVQVSVRNPYLFSALEDRVLTAEFAEIWWDTNESQTKAETYLITSGTSPKDVGIVLGQGNYGSETEVTLTASPNEGINFIKWTEAGKDVVDGNSELVGATYSFTAEADRELVAVFDGAVFNLTASANPVDAGDISVSNDGVFFPGDLATVNAETNAGFSFLNWTLGAEGAQVSANPEYQFTMNADRELLANYKELPKFTLSIEVVPEGAATVSGAGDYTVGSDAVLGVTPNEGHHFVYWSRDAELLSYATDTTVLIQSDMTITAYLELNSYTLSYEAEDNGMIAENMLQIVSHGSDGISVEAIPDSCYAFVEWSDGVTDNPRTDLAIGDDLTVTASFEEVRVDALLSLNGTTLSADNGNASYQWIDCGNGNQVIEGATEQSFTPDVSGSYALILIENNCEVMSECVNVTVDATGINAQTLDPFNFKVYPNPARDRFIVSSETEASFMIMNSLGQAMKTFELNSLNGYTLHIEDLSPGVYIVVGQFGTERVPKRVIISE